MKLTESFEFAFERTMGNEGGFILHKNEGDRGGWTYAGIAENFWSDWAGWPIVRSNPNHPELTRMVKEFYKKNFWDPMRLDEVKDYIISYNIFDFGMNTGIPVAVKLAQVAAGTIPDGAIGPKTLAALNTVDPELFELSYFALKCKRYVSISRKRNRQFFRGWIIRSLNVLEE